MPNPNPKTQQLSLGRGKRPKLNHQTVGMRMSPETKQNLEKIAQAYNCLYGGKPQISGLLDKIAAGELMVVPAPAIVLPPSHAESAKADIFNSKQAIKDHLEKKHFPASSSPSQTPSLESVDDPEPLGMSQHPH